jgi:hypothetical protein
MSLVPVGDTMLVKIRDALDEAPADLSGLPIKLATCERDHFWENGPRRRLCLERLVQRDNVFRLQPESIYKFEDLKLSCIVANFLRDEFHARVRLLIYGEDVRRHL